MKRFFAAVMMCAVCAAAPVFAEGLKDAYKDYFPIGTILNARTVNNNNMRSLVLREFNSVTHENELKPQYTKVRNGSTNENINVTLNSGARAVFKFCEDNGIPVRGHTLVWHSQTPLWFFRTDMSNDNSPILTDTTIMNRRMESYIKNIFALIENDFPNVNLYAYDVVNEAFKNDGGGLRDPGTNTEGSSAQSPWMQVYGSDQFIINAFTYARKHAPQGCKLFYNDYNEYMHSKTNDIYNLAMKLKELNLIDGIGMQAHLSLAWTDFPSPEQFRTALERFASTGLEIQITEIDITVAPNETNFVPQAVRYRDIMREVMKFRDQVTAFVIWGIQDDQSWRASQAPIIFDSKGNRKPAYDSLFVLGAGRAPPPPPPFTPPEPDANGYFFYDTFEDDDFHFWIERGSAALATTSDQAYQGTKSLFVSGRGDNWHGAAYDLDNEAFIPGNSYSFGAMVMCEECSESDVFKITLQYNTTSEPSRDQWKEALEEPVVKGGWTELLNTEFVIPDNAINMLLYIELSSLNDFYVDRAFGGVAGKDGDRPDVSIVPRSTVKRAAPSFFTVKARTLTVEAEPKANVRVKVINLKGRTVERFKSKGSASFSLRKIPAGTYVIEAVKDGQKMSSKITLK